MWRTRLMVVDDDDDVANIICRVAENLGFDVQTASGVGAFDACALFEPDVIVVDIFMPEIDGFEVLRYLGQAHRNTSVIVVSGKDVSFRTMANHMCEQHGLHVLANVAKPFTITKLKTVLEDAKKRHPLHMKIVPAFVDSILSSTSA